MTNSVWTDSLFIPDLTAERDPRYGSRCRCGCIEPEVRARRAGVVGYEEIRVVRNEQGRLITLTPGRVRIIGPKGRVLETFLVPHGADLLPEGAQAAPGQVLARWDPNLSPILSQAAGTVRLGDIVPEETLRRERDETTGIERWVIRDHPGRLHPHVLIESDGQPIAVHYLPVRSILRIENDMNVTPGSVLAVVPREIGGWRSGALPDCMDVFEAKPPREPARLARFTGTVRLGERRRGRRTIFIQAEEQGKRGREVRHIVPPGKHVRVANGDRVERGDRLVFGSLDPQEVLRISGREAVETSLVEGVQDFFRCKGVEIDDKHVEIIVARMLSQVRIIKSGDTDLAPGSVIDRTKFESANERLRGCVKILSSGDSSFPAGAVVSRESFERERAARESKGQAPPTWEALEPAVARVVLLGVSALARRQRDAARR